MLTAYNVLLLILDSVKNVFTFPGEIKGSSDMNKLKRIAVKKKKVRGKCEELNI